MFDIGGLFYFQRGLKLFKSTVRLLLFLPIVLMITVTFAQEPKKRMVFLGDSLTEGYGVAQSKAYPALLQNKFDEEKKNWIVVNAGVSGSTTASALPRLQWQLKNKTDIVIIALGANDGLRGLKIEDSEKNLAKAIDFAKSKNVKVLLAGIMVPPNYGKEYGDRFAKMYVNLSKKHKVKLLPFLLKDVGGVTNMNLADGIHPNEKGHEVMAKTVYEFIKGEL